jgi:hypothetical protein
MVAFCGFLLYTLYGAVDFCGAGLKVARYAGSMDRFARISRTTPYQERKNRGIMIKNILTIYLLLVGRRFGTGKVTTVPMDFSKNRICTGVYEEMRELEGGPTRTMTPEEEEELLNYSEEEGSGPQTGDAEMRRCGMRRCRSRMMAVKQPA